MASAKPKALPMADEQTIGKLALAAATRGDNTWTYAGDA